MSSSLTEPIYNLIRSLPLVTEEPHFDKMAFKVSNKIFATANVALNTLTLKLSTTDQDIFSATSNGAIQPIPNKWGRQGWTVIYLDKVAFQLLTNAVKTAYCQVAPPKLASLIVLD
jgi:predicted DNA-binding protein (MmcQ/YjbR family)